LFYTTYQKEHNMATKTVYRPHRIAVKSAVETHVLASGSQARIVTRDKAGRFVAVTPLTKVNHND
jgi:hypothetical protein